MSQASTAGRTAGDPYALLTMTMVLWGSGFSSSKIVVDHMPHAIAALLRFGGGALVLLVAVRVFDRGTKTSGRDKLRAAVAGVLGVFAYNFFFFWGLSIAPSMDGSTVIPVMSPVLTTMFLLVTRRERASRARVLGLSLGLTGAVVFFIGAGGDTGGGHNRLGGDLLFLLSAACWAAYTLLG